MRVGGGNVRLQGECSEGKCPGGKCTGGNVPRYNSATILSLVLIHICLSPILFNIVMQAIADNFKKGLPWELLYADDLVLLAESRLELEKRLTEWMTRLKE